MLNNLLLLFLLAVHPEILSAALRRVDRAIGLTAISAGPGFTALRVRIRMLGLWPQPQTFFRTCCKALHLGQIFCQGVMPVAGFTVFALVLGNSMEPEFPDGCIVLQGHLIQVAWGHRIAGEDAVIVVAAGG